MTDAPMHGRAGRFLTALFAGFLFAVSGHGAMAQSASAASGDIVLGPPQAPVTIIEYTSLNCQHCKSFFLQVFPRVEAELIKTGKVRYILRDLPVDEIGAAATLIARCRGAETYLKAAKALFEASDDWWAAQRPLPALRAVASRFGFSEAAVEECIRNPAAYATLREGRSAAVAAGIVSVPTFVIGTDRHVGAATFEEIQRLIARQAKRPQP